MTVQTLENEADETPTARIPVQRAPRNRLELGPRHTGPRTWVESAARVRCMRRHARMSRWLALFVVLAALAAAAVIWQLADGRPLELLREGRVLLEPAVEGLRRLL
ncbi:hypothetical protein [Pseudonocardia xishanensis]|uniref:Uncharacterized protein n=1 Tax=Pseudonocardia xishanensis TaxID=630995 RepID=A0ABP8RQL0_9PSEU